MQLQKRIWKMNACPGVEKYLLDYSGLGITFLKSVLILFFLASGDLLIMFCQVCLGTCACSKAVIHFNNMGSKDLGRFAPYAELCNVFSLKIYLSFPSVTCKGNYE